MPTIHKLPRKPKNSEREKEKHRLYASKEWQALRLLKLQQNPMCERCGKKLAEEVHHRVSFMSQPTPELRRQYCLYIDLDGLMSLCSECHKAIHKEIEQKKRKK